MRGKKKGVNYSKWGYLFIAPFFISFFIFSLIPLVDTVRYSFYEYYRTGLKEIGPNFIGLENYRAILSANLWKYTCNTFIMWLLGFIPQTIVALALASWFTDLRMKIHGMEFFKVVMYMPNLIMASALAMLFFTLFTQEGPMNSLLAQIGVISAPIKFFVSKEWTRAIVASLNFLMGFGNTTIMLIAAIMGIDKEIIEVAEIDGCSSTQVFFHITLPLIRPILTFIIITSLIGGLQMFDVPQVLTAGKGAPDRTSMTLIMFLNQHLKAKNYGIAGAISVYIAIISGVLCFIVYHLMEKEPGGAGRPQKKRLS